MITNSSPWDNLKYDEDGGIESLLPIYNPDECLVDNMTWPEYSAIGKTIHETLVRLCEWLDNENLI